MGRRVAVGIAFLVSAVLGACGGGGGSSSVNPPNTPNQGGGAVTANHQVCDGTGRLCLGLDDLTLNAGQSTRYVVTVLDDDGDGQPGVAVEVGDGSNTEIVPGAGSTNEHGQLIGSVEGLFTGQSVVTARVPAMEIEVFLRVTVSGGVVPTPDSTRTGSVVPATVTPTPEDVTQVETIYMETDVFSVSSELGGSVEVRAIAFDGNNEPVNDVNLLFDFNPKVGILRPITTRTRTTTVDGQVLDGVASVIIEIPPGEAPPGAVTVTATSPTASGEVTFTIVPGAAARPPATVLLETSDARCGTDSGGSIVMRAIVFDADNRPLGNVNVLFLTDQGLGRFFPLVQRTGQVGNQGGVAETTLQIPVGAPVRVDSVGNILPYEYRARAGGIEGTAQIFIVPGREPCDGSTTGGGGQPSAITLSASNKAIRVRGNGAVEISQVRAEVKDGGNNEVPGAKVRFFLDPTTTSAGASLLPANPGAGFCSETLQPCGAADQDCPTGESCETDPDNRFVAVTDQAGNAQIAVRAGTSIGTVSVGAEVVSDADDSETVPCSHPDDSGLRCIRAASVSLTVSAGRPGRIALSLNDVFFNNQDGTLITTLAAIVTDGSGNTVPDGTPVLITVGALGEDEQAGQRVAVVGYPQTNGPAPCDVRQFQAQQSFPVTPQPGLAITCVIFPNNLQGADINLVAATGDVSASRVVTLPGSIFDLVAAASPPRVQVTESAPGTSLITAVALDERGDPIPNVQLTFETDPALGNFGAGSNPPWITRQRTNADGVATASLEIDQVGEPEGEVDVMVYGGGLLRILASVVTVEYTASGTIGGGGEPQSIRFLSADPSNITVQGAAGPAQSIVRFEVVDSSGAGVGGIPVDFFVNGLGGASVSPAGTITDSDGIAQTAVLAGIRTSPIQVTASVDADGNGTADLVARSQVVNVVGGRPSAGGLGIAPEFLNVAGGVLSGIENGIFVFVNDRFGNAVAPGTVVNFTANGGTLTNPQPTDEDGVSRAVLLSGNAPASGIVSVLITTIGEESFVDTNGNGERDANESFTDVPEPFLDINGNGRFDADEPGERFVDTNGNSIWDIAQGPGVWNEDAVLFLQQDVTFSGAPILTVEPAEFEALVGESVDFTITVADPNGNPMTSRHNIEGNIVSTVAGGQLVGLGNLGSTAIAIPDAQTFGALVPGANQFNFTYLTPPNTFVAGAEVRINVRLVDPINTQPQTLAPGRNGIASFVVQGIVRERATPTATATPIFTNTNTPPATATPTPTSEPEATATVTFTPRPGAMAFVRAEPASIGVRGSGITEQSVITFRVTNDQAVPIAGARVRFSVQSIGGEAVSPGEATTAADGTVSTVLTSGRRTASARVRAELVDLPAIFTQSASITIIGAPPAADRFSMAVQFLNVAGGVTLGIENVVTAFLNDRFGNAVPQGTSVSFLSNASSVVDPSTSNAQGRASATLITEGGRFPPDGIVRVLGFTRGEEPFIDANGDGIYNPGEVFFDVPEPFIDSDGNGVYDPGNPFDILVDVNDNGIWDSAQGPGVWDANALIFDVVDVTFSGGTVVTLQPNGPFTIEDGGSQSFTLTVSDSLNNPIVGGSTIQINPGTGLELRGLPASFTVPDAQSFGESIDGLNVFTFSVVDAQPGAGDVNQSVEVLVSINSPPSTNAPGGNGSVSISRQGTLLAAPTPIPTATNTNTVAPTNTPTVTNTPTATNTPTNTFTNTPTNTFTNTPTFTATATATP